MEEKLKLLSNRVIKKVVTNVTIENAFNSDYLSQRLKKDFNLALY